MCHFILHCFVDVLVVIVVVGATVAVQLYDTLMVEIMFTESVRMWKWKNVMQFMFVVIIYSFTRAMFGPLVRLYHVI